MWMIGAWPATRYSWTIANDGDATSSGFAPSSEAMARARKVLPAPRSPIRWTTASGASVRAIARPAASVSDSVRQRNWVTSADYRGLSRPTVLRSLIVARCGGSMARTRVSSKYRIVIPKEIRDQIDVRPGQEFEFVAKGGVIT